MRRANPRWVAAWAIAVALTTVAGADAQRAGERVLICNTGRYITIPPSTETANDARVEFFRLDTESGEVAACRYDREKDEIRCR